MFTKLPFCKNKKSNNVGNYISSDWRKHRLTYVFLIMLFFAIAISGTQEETAESQAPSSRIHISIGTGYTSTNAGDDIVYEFKQSGLGGRECFLFFCVDYPQYYGGNLNISLGLDYNITDRLRLGLVFIDHETLEIHGIDNVDENVNISTFGLLLEYVLPRSIQGCFELALGAGATLNNVSVDVMHEPILRDSSNPFKITEDLLGIHLRSSIDWYIWEFLSFQFKIDGNILPSIEVSETTLATYYGIKTLRAHDVSMSSINYTLNLRLHF